MTVLRNTVHSAPDRIVGQAAELALSVSNNVQMVRTNRDGFYALARDARELVIESEKQFPSSLSVLQDSVEHLKQIENFVLKKCSLMGFMKLPSDSKKIAHYRQMLRLEKSKLETFNAQANGSTNAGSLSGAHITASCCIFNEVVGDYDNAVIYNNITNVNSGNVIHSQFGSDTG